MARKGAVISVCKRCGAVGSIKQPHCIFCGGTLSGDMQVRIGQYQDTSKRERSAYGGNDKKKRMTATSFWSVLFGVLGVLMLAFRVLDGGFLFGLLAMIFAIIALCQRKGGGVLAALGIGLGIYTMFVNLFWFFMQFFYMF